jgi:hypothetical protein
MPAANFPFYGLPLLAGIPSRYPLTASRHHLFIHKQKKGLTAP